MPITPWQAGQRITAGRMNLITPVWSSWTPDWETSTGAGTPSLGNATVDCEYCQTGDLVVARFEITFGSSTSFGGGGTTDNWRFGLPVTAAATVNAIGHFGLDTSATTRVYARARLATTSLFELDISTGRVDGAGVTNNGLVDALSPETWGSGDGIRGTLQYRAA
ncbi:hypothetical protein [Streptomyces sp. NPDC057336]|uniref:hypothetical protein n=1 Tax=Streptomyces sp. NPDC057336 TaxID=3346102 RepID=UPI00363D88AF